MNIKEIIKQYCENKEQEKALKNEISEQGKSIKTYMADHEDKPIEVDGYTVSIQERKTEDVNPEQMLNAVLNWWGAKAMGSMQCPFVKYVPAIDMEALESAIYNEQVDKDLLLEIDKCRTVKVTRALVYKAKKEEN